MTKLAVVESRWWENGNDSVRGFFDTLASIHELGDKDYHYEMFNNRNSLREIVPRIARRVNALYIAAHGDENTIFGAEGRESNAISRRVFRNIVRAGVAERGGKLDGVYIGSCGFLNRNTVSFLFQPDDDGQSVRVNWLAGYSKTVDFIESTAIDIFFWNEYMCTEGTARQKIKSVAKKSKTVFKRRYLCEEMGFNIFVRRLGPGGGVMPLVCNND